MSTRSATPRTKAVTFVLYTDYGEDVDVVHPEEMEALERELNEAKAEIQSLKDAVVFEELEALDKRHEHSS